MRKILVFVSIPILLYASFGLAKHFWRGETMAPSKVCKTWGDKTFEIAKFKNGKEAERAAMACNLLKSQKVFVGKDRSEIRSELGDPDGFYFTDMFPAYIIGPEAPKSKNTWQIVFFLDRNEKVSEIVVHKNCCD